MGCFPLLSLNSGANWRLPGSQPQHRTLFSVFASKGGRLADLGKWLRRGRGGEVRGGSRLTRLLEKNRLLEENAFLLIVKHSCAHCETVGKCR